MRYRIQPMALPSRRTGYVAWRNRRERCAPELEGPPLEPERSCELERLLGKKTLQTESCPNSRPGQDRCRGTGCHGNTGVVLAATPRWSQRGAVGVALRFTAASRRARASSADQMEA